MVETVGPLLCIIIHLKFGQKVHHNFWIRSTPPPFCPKFKNHLIHKKCPKTFGLFWNPPFPSWKKAKLKILFFWKASLANQPICLVIQNRRYFWTNGAIYKFSRNKNVQQLFYILVFMIVSIFFYRFWPWWEGRGEGGGPPADITTYRLNRPCGRFSEQFWNI